MDKRTFLKTGLFGTAVTLLNPFQLIAGSPTLSFEPESMAPGSFKLPDLSYQFDALEPHIDKMTMEIHHGKHHAAYVNNLNKAVDGTVYEKMTIEQIIESVKSGDTAIRNNGGGHFNHSMFWKLLAPKSGSAPKGKIADLINAKFTSFDKFKEQFNTAATTRFGSGWAWLIVTKKGELAVVSTANQDNPLMGKILKAEYGYPVLGLDVWEHAYYLKYQNKRPDYIAAFWNLVNWDEVNKNYEMGMKKFGKKA